MDKKIITGKDPFKTFITARDMFYDVEAEVLKKELIEGDSEKVVIFCTENNKKYVCYTDYYYFILEQVHIK